MTVETATRIMHALDELIDAHLIRHGKEDITALELALILQEFIGISLQDKQIQPPEN